MLEVCPLRAYLGSGGLRQAQSERGKDFNVPDHVTFPLNIVCRLPSILLKSALSSGFINRSFRPMDLHL